jgi:hypothetical protein
MKRAIRRRTRASPASIYWLRAPTFAPNLGAVFASMLISPVMPTKAADGTLVIARGSLVGSFRVGRSTIGVAFAIGVEGHDDVDARISLIVVGPDGQQAGDAVEFREKLQGKGFCAHALAFKADLPKGDNELSLLVNGERVAMCRLSAS